MIGRVAAALLLSATAAQAEWVQLDNTGIVAALTDRGFVYDNGATQRFFASGRTRYTAAEPSWGYWRAENGQYCSQWPPGEAWDCYDLFAGDAGAIRFDDASGNSTTGMPQP